MLEGLCARWATEHITREQLDNLEETLCLTEYHTEKKNYDKLYELDSLFHEQLYEAGGSRILNHVLSDFHDYVKMVRKATISTSSRSVIAVIKTLFQGKAWDCVLIRNAPLRGIMRSMIPVRRVQGWGLPERTLTGNV